MYQGGYRWQRGKVQRKLDELEKDGIMEKVTEPTPWISSMITVVKPKGKLQPGFAWVPKDLNRAVLQEKYQLPTIEDVQNVSVQNICLC